MGIWKSDYMHKDRVKALRGFEKFIQKHPDSVTQLYVIVREAPVAEVRIAALNRLTLEDKHLVEYAINNDTDENVRAEAKRILAIMETTPELLVKRKEETKYPCPRCGSVSATVTQMPYDAVVVSCSACGMISETSKTLWGEKKFTVTP